MENIWLNIPLADYEGHMAAPHVGQAAMLSDLFAEALAVHRPRSLALIGCAGGNGLERIAIECALRVVALDLNPAYLAATAARYAGRLSGLELVAADLETGPIPCAAVDLAFAGLVFEHARPELALPQLAALVAPEGILLSVLQLPSPHQPILSASTFATLAPLAATTELVQPARLETLAAKHGFVRLDSRAIELASGKTFQVLSFRRARD